MGTTFPLTEYPMSAEVETLTPPQLARKLGVKPEKVIYWIKTGQLRAINMAEKPDGYARYRIYPADVEAFQKTRETVPTA